MPVFGRGAKGVMIIGEAPSKDDDEAGKPFRGESGEYLRSTLAKIGVDLERDAWSTNALICHPSDSKEMDAKRVSYCRPNVLNAIKDHQPKVIITLGRMPLQSVLEGQWRDIGVMDRWTGWKIPLCSFWLCPTFHPSFLRRMRNSLMEEQFSDHLQAAFDIDDEPPVRIDYEKEVEVLYDEDAVWEAAKEIDRNSDWIAVDYETNCLKPDYLKAQIFSCAISSDQRTISYLWRGRSIKATQHLLRSKRTRKIASNLKFEERWTRKVFGHGVRNWGWDTMLATHCLDNRQGICSLKFQAMVRLGVPVYNEHIAPYLSSTGHYNRIKEVDTRQLLLYGGADALFERKLAALQREDFGAD